MKPESVSAQLTVRSGVANLIPPEPNTAVSAVTPGGLIVTADAFDTATPIVKIARTLARSALAFVMATTFIQGTTPGVVPWMNERNDS